jgi:hypothetical protein
MALRHISYPTMVLGKVRLASEQKLTSVMQTDSGPPFKRPTLPSAILPSQVLCCSTGHRRHQLIHAHG